MGGGPTTGPFGGHLPSNIISGAGFTPPLSRWRCLSWSMRDLREPSTEQPMCDTPLHLHRSSASLARAMPSLAPQPQGPASFGFVYRMSRQGDMIVACLIGSEPHDRNGGHTLLMSSQVP